jgi:hypothetical protein
VTSTASGPPPELSTAAVWRRLSFGLFPIATDLDLLRLNASLGCASDTRSWRLRDAATGARFEATLGAASGGDTRDDNSSDRLTVDFRTREVDGLTEGHGQDLDQDEFLRSFADSLIGASPLPVAAYVVVSFPSTSRWRLPLLTNPPEIDDDGLGLGKISLGGITLRFGPSPSGLFQAELESSLVNNERLVSLTFALALAKEHVIQVVSAVRSTAMRLSSLFVAIDPSPAATGVAEQ